MTGRPVTHTQISREPYYLLRKFGILPEDLNYKLKHKMKNVLDFLDGKKMYIGTAIVFVAGGLKAIKVIDEDSFQAMLAIGGAVASFGLRSALKKLQ